MTVSELIAALQEMPQMIATGMHDVAGTEIRTGDIVEFWFCADRGFSSVADPDMTRMVDAVEHRHGAFYATDYDTCGGMFLWKLDGACRVIGNVRDNPQVLIDSLWRFRLPVGTTL